MAHFKEGNLLSVIDALETVVEHLFFWKIILIFFSWLQVLLGHLKKYLYLCPPLLFKYCPVPTSTADRTNKTKIDEIVLEKIKGEMCVVWKSIYVVSPRCICRPIYRTPPPPHHFFISQSTNNKANPDPNLKHIFMFLNPLQLFEPRQ